MAKQRGIAVFVAIVVIAGGSLASALVYDGFADLKSAEIRRTIAAKNAAKNARRALFNYMLSRPARPFNIARPGGAAIFPRLLMLPCPDNIGDHDLDGTQDPHCGANGRSRRNITNGILDSGSRFGRLPYRQKFPDPEENLIPENEINDGLAGDFDGGGMLWYAVAQNFAPATNGAPLNMHRLDAQTEGWLQVAYFVPARTSLLLTVNSRVAAVVLAPGKTGQGRKAEETLATLSLNVGDVNASAYFESAGGESNADANGVFVQMPQPSAAGAATTTTVEFDDQIDFIGMSDLLNPDGNFMRNYLAAAGIGAVHNAPAARSPLAEIYRAFVDWKNVFGFYPIPAANTAQHINNRARHCAAHHLTADATVKIAGVTLLSPTAANVARPGGTGMATITLQNDSGFLTAFPATATVAIVSAVVADNTTTINGTITLARYARITLTAGASVIIDSAALISGNVLPPGADAILAGNTDAIVANGAPLSSQRMTGGWLPEHHRTTMRIARDGAQLPLLTETKTGFLSDATITSAVNTISISSQDQLFLQSSVRIEEDFPQLTFLYDNAILVTNGITTTLQQSDNYKPDVESFTRRNFAVILLADIPRPSITIFAPQIIYPWREQTDPRKTDSRDNLHPYPPCFDSRGLSRNARTFIEDQNIFYAVSPNCRDGGACGGGITVSVAAGARFAAPSPITVTNSFTVTIAAATIQINQGTAATIARNGVPLSGLTLANEFAVSLGADAAAVLPADFVFQHGETIVVPAGATVSAGGQTHIDAEAVMIYSPAPLFATRCITGMTVGINPYISTTGITLANQGGGGADLTDLCQWLDDDENANGDALFHLQLPTPDLQTNDYFLFFGGQTIVQ